MPTAPLHRPAASRGRSRRIARALSLALAAVLVAIVPAGAHAAGSTDPYVLGDYATPLVGPPDADGVNHIDIAGTIAKLSAAHVNTYAYLIFDSPLYGTAPEAVTTQAQWDDLPAFASAAAHARINVLVYLVPPTESTQTGYMPFGWDYHAWADAIATVAASHPNIREMVMDDFAANTVEGGSKKAFAFTPGYVSDMMASARKTAPWLKFRVIMYYPNYVGSGAVMPAYRSSVDGVIFPYRANNPGGAGFNTTDASAAGQQGGVVGAMTKCHGGDGCVQFAFPRSTPSAAGQFAAVNRTISVTSGSAKTLTFWEQDDFNSTTSGFHFLQALIDGAVVWQTDVAASSDGLWHQISVDVSTALDGKKSATLTFRLWDARAVSNFHVAAWVDDVAGDGFAIGDGDFEDSGLGPWRSSTNGSAFSVTKVPTLSYYYMTYATKFSSETVPTSAGYVQAVLGQALSLMSSGIADGSIVYSLNLTGEADGRSDPDVYTAVQNAYASFSPS